MTLNERVRRRLREEKDRKRLSEKEVGQIIGSWPQSRVSQKLIGRTPITLDDLEALCHGLSLNPVEAVRDPTVDFVAELTPDEAQLLERYRAVTPATQAALRYFANNVKEAQADNKYDQNPRQPAKARLRG